MVRGRGYLKLVADIEQVVARRRCARGTPVRVGDVAEVRLGPDIRRGVAELDGSGEVVGGIVVMRFGENALRVIDASRPSCRRCREPCLTGVRDRADLRSVESDPRLDRDVAPHADRGSRRRLAGCHRFSCFTSGRRWCRSSRCRSRSWRRSSRCITSA